MHHIHIRIKMKAAWNCTESVLFAGCTITWLLWTCVFLLSIHLLCWLDLEQYRRTPQKEQAVRQERSSHIATKYLNRQFFFGSDSPATTEQQNDVRQSITWFKKKLHSVLLANILILESSQLQILEIELLSSSWKASERQGQKNGAHDMTIPRWDASSSWGSTSRFDKQRLPWLTQFPISRLWHPGDFMLTALTAGCRWETGDEGTWLELKQEEERGLDPERRRRSAPVTMTVGWNLSWHL